MLHNPRIVNKNRNIQPLNPFLDSVKHLLVNEGIDEVCDYDFDLACRVDLFKFLFEVVELVEVSADEDHVVPFSGETETYLFSDAVGGACDDGPSVSVALLEILFFAVEVVVANDFEEEVEELDEADPVGEGEQHRVD